MGKVRLDRLVVESGLTSTREKARRLILAGEVLVNNLPVEKPGTQVDSQALLRLRNPPSPFVGRGGEKLAGALDELGYCYEKGMGIPRDLGVALVHYDRAIQAGAVPAAYRKAELLYKSQEGPANTSLICDLLTMAAEVTGVLSWHTWHAAVAIAVLALMITLALIGRLGRQAKLPLLHPGQIKELAEIIDRVSNQTGDRKHGKTPSVPVGCMSTGVQLSTGRIPGPAEHIRHYALSQRNHRMTEKTARRLGSMIQLLRHPADSLEIMQGNQAIYHLLFHEIK